MTSAAKANRTADIVDRLEAEIQRLYLANKQSMAQADMRSAENVKLRQENERLTAAVNDKWKVVTDDSVIYLTATNNRPARAVELEHGIVLRFASDNGELVGLTLLFPADLTYETVSGVEQKESNG